MNNGNEKHPKKIKVKLRYDLLWSKFAQKFQQTIQRLLNVPIVARYWCEVLCYLQSGKIRVVVLQN